MGRPLKTMLDWAETVEQLMIEYIGEEIALRMKKAYIRVINAFYDDYEPKRYKRTWSTYQASNANKANSLADFLKNGDVKFSSNANGRRVRAGIKVNADNIKGTPYYRLFGEDNRFLGDPVFSRHTPVDTKVVFYNTFVKGKHGYVPKVMKPSPIKLMRKEREEIKADLPNICERAQIKSIEEGRRRLRAAETRLFK